MQPVSNGSGSEDAKAWSGADASVASSVAEREAGVGLLLGNADGPAPRSEVLQFVNAAARRGIRIGELVVARVGGRVVWAALPIRSAGRVALVLCPGVGPAESAAAGARKAIDVACGLVAATGTVLAQALVDVAAGPMLAAYGDSGFVRMATLNYMETTVRAVPGPARNGPRVVTQRYSAAQHDRFAATILATYGQSLDCPELSGLRSIDDVIEGHKASGSGFDPTLWHLLIDEGGRAVGVLLLGAHMGGSGTFGEVVYMGITPEARGKGYSDVAMRLALQQCHERSYRTLTLAVDDRNAPAVRLYRRFGFVPTFSKVALMRDLRRG